MLWAHLLYLGSNDKVFQLFSVAPIGLSILSRLALMRSAAHDSTGYPYEASK